MRGRPSACGARPWPWRGMRFSSHNTRNAHRVAGCITIGIVVCPPIHNCRVAAAARATRSVVGIGPVVAIRGSPVEKAFPICSLKAMIGHGDCPWQSRRRCRRPALHCGNGGAKEVGVGTEGRTSESPEARLPNPHWAAECSGISVHGNISPRGGGVPSMRLRRLRGRAESTGEVDGRFRRVWKAPKTSPLMTWEGHPQIEISVPSEPFSRARVPPMNDRVDGNEISRCAPSRLGRRVRANWGGLLRGKTDERARLTERWVPRRDRSELRELTCIHR
jgi:hypothetical protein